MWFIWIGEKHIQGFLIAFSTSLLFFYDVACAEMGVERSLCIMRMIIIHFLAHLS